MSSSYAPDVIIDNDTLTIEQLHMLDDQLGEDTPGLFRHVDMIRVRKGFFIEDQRKGPQEISEINVFYTAQALRDNHQEDEALRTIVVAKPTSESKDFKILLDNTTVVVMASVSHVVKMLSVGSKSISEPFSSVDRDEEAGFVVHKFSQRFTDFVTNTDNTSANPREEFTKYIKEYVRQFTKKEVLAMGSVNKKINPAIATQMFVFILEYEHEHLMHRDIWIKDCRETDFGKSDIGRPLNAKRIFNHTYDWVRERFADRSHMKTHVLVY